MESSKQNQLPKLANPNGLVVTFNNAHKGVLCVLDNIKLIYRAYFLHSCVLK